MPPADYNVAPSTFQPVIRESREDGSREMVLMRWGLIPFFTKDVASVTGISTINARAETVPTAPTWRETLQEASLSCACRLLLGVEEARCEDEAAVRLQRGRKLDIRFRWPLGRVEGWPGTLVTVVQHCDYLC